MLKRIASEDSGVIATGGGTFTSPENREIIRSAGVSIWLDAPTEQIIDRGASDDRPLWGDAERARKLLASRLTDYRQADLRFDLKTSSPMEAVEQLVKLISSTT
jgi:shikimate kinase